LSPPSSPPARQLSDGSWPCSPRGSWPLLLLASEEAIVGGRRPGFPESHGELPGGRISPAPALRRERPSEAYVPSPREFVF
jgi:hypothetical protein